MSAALVGVSASAPSSPALADTADPCAADGLRNPGFEHGVSGGDPLCWELAAESDRVEVIDEEGPADSPVYADAGITVTAPRGSSMLALGGPKQQSESQASQPDRVSQTFVAAAASFELQLRVFSWEHRNVDAVDVSIDGGAHVDVTLEDTATFTEGGCADGACAFTIDTGKRGDKNLLDTGWRIVTVSGLEAGSTYTLDVAAGSTDRTSFATWAYLDDVNSPPVARFDLDRSEDCTFAPVDSLFEGQPVPLIDCSFDADGEIVSREWTVTFGGEVSAADSRSSGFILPGDQGEYQIELTVTDDDGLTDTVVVGGAGQTCPDGTPGGVARDGTCLPAIVLQDSPPLVDAIDVQAVAGTQVELVARYGDAGAADDHVVDVDGSLLPRCSAEVGAPCFDEDNLPAVESGIVLADASVPETPGESSSATVTVRDDDTGAQTSDVATLSAISADPVQFEQALGSTDDARVITLGGRYADWIDRPGDVDLFEVTWPGAAGAPPQPLPVGTELLVNLRDLPADYDVAVLVGRGDGAIDDGEVAPGQFLPGQFLPGQFLPGQFLPGQFLPGQFLPGQFLPGQFLPGQFLPGQFLPGQVAELFRAPGQFLPGQFLPGQFLPGQFLPEIVPGQFLSSVYDLTDPDLAIGLAPYAVNPFQLYPLSQREYTGTSGATGTGADVDIDELGLGPVADGLQVAGYAANRGTDDDSVLIRVDEFGSEVYVVVIGANGEFSSVEPYALQVEGSVPFDAVTLAAGRTDLFGGVCQRTPRTDEDGPSGTTVTPYVDDVDGDDETLFVTSWERLEWSARQVDPAAEPLARGAIESLLPDVGGAVLDLSDQVFVDWDNATCDPARANAVADVARDAVLAELAANDYEHVVIVGGDDVVPFRRVVDETRFSNETQYATGSFLTPGQPLFASKAGGYHLTDAHLTDEMPTPWRGRQLWVGDRSTSRLVETELEIAAQVEAFRATGGQLDLDTALVTGSEFFDDGAAAIADAFGAGGVEVAPEIDPVDAPSESLGTAAEYRCKVFGTGCDETTGPALTGDVNSVNAHYQHFVSFSPRGAANADPAEVIATSDVTDAVAGTLFMTIGCQAGLAVPDDEVRVDEIAPGVRTSLDWAQALAQQQAVMIGNTGYGLGDDAGVGYTELLHTYIAEELLVQPTVGAAVREAGRRYLSSVTQFDEYHEKTLVQTVLYGLPFYGTGASGTSTSTSTATASSTEAISTPSAPVTPAADVVSTQPVSTTGDVAIDATLQRIETDRGTYYAADGGVLATLERPKQPLVVVPVPPEGPPAHGVLIRHEGDAPSGSAGTFIDESGFDPVIQSPTSEWLGGGGETQRCLDAWWPSTLAQVNTLDLGGELRQTVSIKPGQFRCRSGAADVVSGTQRLFDQLPLQLLRSADDDFQAPVIRRVDFDPMADGQSPPALDVRVRLDDDADAADLTQIVVLRLRVDGTIVSEDATFSVDGPDVHFTLADLQDEEGFLLQFVDTANNVTTYTGKSTVPSIIEVEASGPPVAVDGQPVTLTAVISGYADKVAAGLLVEPVWYSWDFGAEVAFEGRATDRTSGLVTPGSEPGTDIRLEDTDGDGIDDAVIDVTVVYGATSPDPIVTVARVVDSDGGIGLDDHVMRFGCDAADVPDYPDADLIGCGVDVGATTDTGDAGVGFAVTVAGAISPDFQYRVGFDTDGNGGVDKSVKYDDGKLSGSLSRVTTAALSDDGQSLLVTVPLADVVTACPDDPAGQCVVWQLETQGGVAGGPGLGFLDQARDELTVTPVP